MFAYDEMSLGILIVYVCCHVSSYLSLVTFYYILFVAAPAYCHVQYI